MMKKIQKHTFTHDAFIRIALLCIVFSFSTLSTISAQEVSDTLRLDTSETKIKEKKGSIFEGRPGKSLVFSLVIPGTGQIYNKSYLRVPFVWAAVGGVGYLVVHNTKVYQYRRDAYIAATDGTPFPNKRPKGETDRSLQTASTIRVYRDSANNAKQQSIIGFALVWLANGVDAFVDAHLKDFDIDEDLSIDIGPRMDDDPYAPMRMGVFVQF